MHNADSICGDQCPSQYLDLPPEAQPAMLSPHTSEFHESLTLHTIWLPHKELNW